LEEVRAKIGNGANESAPSVKRLSVEPESDEDKFQYEKSGWATYPKDKPWLRGILQPKRSP
jgi:hypothetical protein